MKKLLALALPALALAVLLLLRAHTAFPDRQRTDAARITPVELDAASLAERLGAALRFPTISYDDRSQFDPEAFLALHRYLAAQYAHVHSVGERRVINDYSLVYRFEGRDPGLKPVLFMGHMDVVPVDPATADDWIHAPFSGAVVDGVVWGRGAMDDKLTGMALMEAMEALLARGERPARTVYFAFGHDEEVGGGDGAAQIAAHFRSDGIEFEFVLDEGGAVTDGLIPGLDSPIAMIGTAEKGYVNVHLNVEAPGGHSSQPPPHTAAGILAAAIVRIESHPFPADLGAMDGNFAFLGHHFPLGMRIALANRWLFGTLVERTLLDNPATAASIRTTTAVTMLEGSSKSNILPTMAEAVVNLRILPGDTVAGVRDRIEAVIDDPAVAVTAHMGIEPSPVSPTDSFGFRLLERTIRGMDPTILVAPYLVQGGTDAKHFTDLSTSVYRFVMFRADATSMQRIHGVNEQIAVEQYVNAVRFYHALLQGLDDAPVATAPAAAL